MTELADLFRLLGDPTRLRIVQSCAEGPMAVHDMAARQDLSSSLISHHLRLLRAARIVKADRQGKQVFYTAADQHISSVLADMLEHIAEAHAAGNHHCLPVLRRRCTVKDSGNAIVGVDRNQPRPAP